MSEEPTRRRIMFTSLPALVTALTLSTILLVASLGFWWAIGPAARAAMTWPQTATLVGIVMILMGVMMSVGYSRLWADEGGVTVRNGPVLRRYQVSQIVGTRLRSGDAWAYLLVKAEDKVVRRPVLAIQQLEGQGGRDKVKQLRAWLKSEGASSAGITLDDD
ncbi:MAG: PH domain-containing protein [Arachnia sp.]